MHSADGEKLQRAFIPDAGGSGTVTTYINQFVFQETATLTTSSPAPFSGTGVGLAYINFEEGRVRVMKANSTGNGYDALTEGGNITLPASPSGGGGTGAFDYFIMDYQQNVRMILTEETHSAVNTCTMETSRASAEDPVFEAAPGDEVETTRYAKPSGWTNNSTAMVSQVGRLCGHYIGPNTLQKVMAGDQVTASVQYYLQTGETGTNPNIVRPLLASLSQAIGGASTVGTLVHGSGSAITTNLNGVPAFTTAVEPNSNTTGTAQAYLTILFFDERFNLIAAADGGVAQAQVASSWSTSTPALTLNGKAPKNGYMYIYVSNRSDQDVYFDNMVVNVVAGNIIEENHYYAFGLKIAAISSHKLQDVNEGKMSNPYQYNDKEQLDEDAGLNWYDYGFRNYDPQIGRFMQLDPLTWDYEELTPYQFAGNDPVANMDVDGLEPANVLKFASSFGNGSTIVSQIMTGINAGSWEVKWSEGLTAYAKIFKATSTVTRTTSLIGLGVKAASVLNHLTGGDPSTSGRKWQAYLVLVSARGAADALANANSLGIYDLFGGNHLDSYNKDDEKGAYLNGRRTGDAIAIAQGASEIEGGITGGAATAIETGGIGALVGGSVALHGAIAGGIATADMANTLQKLYHLSNASNGAGDANNSSSHSNTSSGTPQKYNNQVHSKDAEQIGNGHAWEKHKDEFPDLKTQDEFKSLIDNILKSPGSLYKKLQRGRKAWYDKSKNILVIKDPNHVDGGTIFKPGDGIDYFNKTLK